MSFFRIRWLRRFIRRNTSPIPEKVALDWKSKLSIAYMLLAWNAAGVVMYMCFSGKSDWPKYYGIKTDEEASKKPAIYYSELLGIKKAHIISVSGFRKISEMDYNEDEKPTTDKLE